VRIKLDKLKLFIQRDNVLSRLKNIVKFDEHLSFKIEE
jgi:hypothetical protein